MSAQKPGAMGLADWTKGGQQTTGSARNVADFFKNGQLADSQWSQPRYPGELNIQELFTRYNLLMASSCGTLAKKIDNIENHLRAIEDQNREMARIQRTISLLDKAIFVTTLVRDTCVLVLDAASAVVPGLGGKVAMAGVIAIDTASSLTEMATGQADVDAALLRSIGSVNTAFSLPGAGGTVAQYKGQQGLNFVQGVKGMADAKTPEGRRQEGVKMTVALAADTIRGAVETMPSTATTRSVAGIASTVKSGYALFVNTSNSYQELVKVEKQRANDQMTAQHTFDIAVHRLNSSLRQCKLQLEQCKKREGLT